MAETLGDRIDAFARWAADVGGLLWPELDEDGPETLAGLLAEADAAEALALATAARVEAEARRDMANRIEREIYDSCNRGKRVWSDERAERGKRAASRKYALLPVVDAARQAECAALARWREVRGG